MQGANLSLEQEVALFGANTADRRTLLLAENGNQVALISEHIAASQMCRPVEQMLASWRTIRSDRVRNGRARRMNFNPALALVITHRLEADDRSRGFGVKLQIVHKMRGAIVFARLE